MLVRMKPHQPQGPQKMKTFISPFGTKHSPDMGWVRIGNPEAEHNGETCRDYLTRITCDPDYGTEGLPPLFDVVETIEEAQAIEDKEEAARLGKMGKTRYSSPARAPVVQTMDAPADPPTAMPVMPEAGSEPVVVRRKGGLADMPLAGQSAVTPEKKSAKGRPARK